MADGDVRRNDALMSNPIMQDVNGSIAHILCQIGCKPKEDIIKNLWEDIDITLIQECREFVFGVAVGMYDEQLEDHGITSGKAKLELKNRRGESAHERCASDIVEIVVYICGLVSGFPRNVLGSRSTYIDVEGHDHAANMHMNSGNITVPGVANECHDKSEYGQLIQTLMDKCDKYASDLLKLREYVLNVEKIFGDEIKLLKSNKKCEKADMNELKHESTGIGSTAEPKVAADRDAASTNPWQTETGHGLLSTGAETSNHETLTMSEQLNGTESAVSDQNVSLNALLGDETQSSSQGIGEEDGDDEEDGIISESDEISCGQRHRKDKKAVKTKSSTQSYNANNQTQNTATRNTSTQHGNTSQDAPHAQEGSDSGRAHVTSGASSNQAQRPSTNDQFTEVTPRRNRNRSPQSNNKILRGRKIEEAEELYVQNIAIEQGESLKDVADMVRAHCVKKGIRIMSARTITNKFCRDVVGCRITIPVRQTDDALGIRIWPDGMSCRRWRKSARNNENNESRESRQDNRGNSCNNNGRNDRSQLNQNHRGNRLHNPRRGQQNDNHGYEYDNYRDHDERNDNRNLERGSGYDDRNQDDYFYRYSGADDQSRYLSERRSYDEDTQWESDRQSRYQNNRRQGQNYGERGY